MDSSSRVKEDNDNFDFEGKNWIYQGLGFGIIMFVMMGILFPILDESISYSNSKYSLVMLFIIYIIGGLIYGIAVKYVLRFIGK
jgi:hypothetical protein